MQFRPHQLAWVAILVVTVFTSALQAQGPGPVVIVQPPRVTTLGVQTTVTLPNGGYVKVASYSQAAEIRSEYGSPGLSKIPYIGRGTRNVAVGRSLSRTSVGVTARIIDLRDEEYRQTGYRRP